MSALTPQMPPVPPALGRVRRAIDAIDDTLLVLLAGRGALARRAAALKHDAGRPARDPAREARIHARARRLAPHLGLPTETARMLIDLAIADACRQQRLAADLGHGQLASGEDTIPSMPAPDHTLAPGRRFALRCIPPPARLAPLLRMVPVSFTEQLLERAMTRVLAAPLAGDDLDFMDGRYLGIEVSDLGLAWVVACRDGRLQVCDGTAEASVRGTVTDLLLLASRLEDADTLFFQRRLVLTGDTELGLTVRNLLERLPWESLPLSLRIGLNRGARLARAARDVHHGRV